MDFKKAIEASIEPLVQGIAALCRINSVEDKAKPGMPFGEGVAQALHAALKMGEDMGFNYGRWKFLGKKQQQEPRAVYILKTYEEHVDYLVTWMQNRKEWLDMAFGV